MRVTPVRAARNALWTAALGFGIAAELAGAPPLPALDAITGFSLLALGLIARARARRSVVGWILAAAGVAWFAGTLAGWAVFWHRAPLAQLILTYPATRLWPESRVERAAVTLAYLYAVAYPVAGNVEATIVFALVLLGLAGWRYLTARGSQRRARRIALLAALPFSVVLIAGATLQLVGGGGEQSQVLAAYELVIVVVAGAVSVDLLWASGAQGLVTAVVVELGEPLAASTLRARLARTLGDPTLTVGYWVSEQNGYVDEEGRSLALPADEHGRSVSLIDDAGTPLAALIHDRAVLNTPELVADITAATRLAVSNARLQAEIRARVAQVEASRRRLVQAADEQRRQLERELRAGAEQRLTRVAELLSDAGPRLEEVTAGLDAARGELRELARGIHPAMLTDHGLREALGELADRSLIPVQVSAPAQRWPAAVEAAAYFLCSEAVTNATKYAHASRIHIDVSSDDVQLRVQIADDGIGGAAPTRGSGLRGLADRVEALGGHLALDSPAGLGTRLTARLPLS